MPDEKRPPAHLRGPLPGHEPAPARLGEDASGKRRFVSTRVEIEGREETKIVELPTLEPEPWGPDAELTIVGQRVPRMDAVEKVTGRARYTADLHRPGMLHTAIVRSPIAHGRVTRLDLSVALALPGVRGALVREDVKGVTVDGFPLFDDAIHYAGQPLAAICAESFGAVRHALDLVVLETQASAHVVTAEAALAADAPRVRPKGNQPRSSPRLTERGDVDAALRDAEVIVRREYRTPTALHTALEPHGAVAEWLAGQVTVWESTQGIFNTRSDLADAFGLPLSRVRVVKNYMGGGFGAKNGASASTYIAVAAARKFGVAVRCVLDREGEQTDAGNRPATTQRVTLAAKRDGTLVAIDLDASVAMGAGGWMAGPGRIYHELYRCANVRTREAFVFTNAGAMASFRAPGHVEGAFGLECAMDALARELGMDPIELRRRNYADRDQAKGRTYSDKRLDECYVLGAGKFGWGKPRGAGRGERGAGSTDGDGAKPGDHSPDHAPAPRAPHPAPRWRRGHGMASLTWGVGGGPPAYASVRLNGDGSVDVLTGSQDLGTGSRTVLAQIAAESLGVALDQVRTVLGDTERLPYTPNSWGSITTASVGPAVRVAAEEAKRTLLEAAAEVLEGRGGRGEGRGELRIRDGIIARVDGSDTITVREVCEALGDVMIQGHGSRGPNPENTAIPAFGAQFAEVEVDTETGIVRVLRIVSVHDAGRIINPTLAESQLEGGIIQGLGYALFEERVMDERLGLSLNPTMHDYKIPTLADVPKIEVFCLDGADTVANHTGAKGIAEPPIIPTAPAIANAVADALGVEVLEIPLTPWRVLGALSTG